MKCNLTIVVAALVGFWGAASVEAQEKTTLSVSGATTVQPIVETAAKEFQKTHPNVLFAIGGGGSTRGVKTTAGGEVSLGMISRDLQKEELAAHTDLKLVTIGLDGVAIIVNAQNPLTKITKPQVQALYTGKITNWKELGGADAPVVLIAKEPGHSTLELFLEHFGLEEKTNGEGKARTMTHRIKNEGDYSQVAAQIGGGNLEILAMVSTRPNAVAYVSVGSAEMVASKGGRVKLLDLDGIPATVKTVGEKVYPLRRPLSVVTKGQPTGAVKEFIDFLLSAQGQAIVAKLDFVPL